MTSDSDNDLSFAVLDALLDQALDLKGDELALLLGNLGEAQRRALLELLEKSQTGSLSHIGAAAQGAVRQLDGGASGVNARAGEWQLKKEIGSGGTGQVFYAERHELEENKGDNPDAFVQRAAVKVLWSHRVRSQFRDRFLRERRILASIDHPGLARFLDGGLLGDGRPWFAMEYVDGDHIVAFTKSRPVDERLMLFAEVADTINYAHRRLIVHRDIKPQNILVDVFGKPRVLDFGIAGILGEFDTQELTQVQGAPLTLQYASPEQVTGGSVDVASDVYQLGLLLYEMLTDKKPYPVDDTSLQVAINTICNQAPTSLSTHVEKLSPDLDAIVTKALRKEPAERYPSAAAMADDVRRFIAGRPITARPQSQWYILSRFVRRNVLLTSVVTGSVVALTIATVFSINRAIEANAQAQRSRITQGILADVFEQADPFGHGGSKVTLADALIRAKPFIEEKVADDPRLAWEVNKTLAGIFTNLDLLDLERKALRDAWEAAQKLGVDNEPELLFAIAGLGNILVRTDPREGIEFLAENLPQSPSTQAGAVEWLSAKYAEVSAYNRLRDDEEAAKGVHDMARVARDFDIDAPRTLGRIDQLLAGVARRAGDLDAADSHWASAVENMRRADAPLALAVTLSNHALHYGMTKRYDASVAAFQESIKIFRSHETNNTSHANVLRLYAGLLFRMKRPDEAQAALGEALSILDPQEQSYAYFVAQLNRANFAFARGDPATAFDAIEGGLKIAVPAFGHNSEVTQRMLPVFMRLLLFSDHVSQAASLVGLEDRRLCIDRDALLVAIDNALIELADTPDTETARQTVWKEIDAIRRAAMERTLQSDEVAAVFVIYRDPPDVFLDVLDRFRFIVALSDIVAASDITAPSELQAEFQRLQVLQTQTRSFLEGNPRLLSLLDSIRPGFSEICDSF